jgi:lambda family phage portal protein
VGLSATTYQHGQPVLDASGGRLTSSLRRFADGVLTPILGRLGYESRAIANLRAAAASDAAFLSRFTNDVRNGRPVGYAGGRYQRSDPDFYPSAIGPNAAFDMYGDLLLRRVRELVGSNPLIRGAMRTFIDQVVGGGIVVQPDTGDDNLNTMLEEAWNEFALGVDMHRKASLYDSQRLALREFWTSGECFVHFVVQDEFRGTPSGWAIDLIPSERLPISDGLLSQLASIYASVPAANAARVRQAIELDNRNRVVAYHVLASEPNDNGFQPAKTVRLASDAVEHLFIQDRAAQLRGLPHALAAVHTSRDLDAFMEATIYQARGIAAMGMVVKSRGRAGKNVSAPVVDLNGDLVQDISPGFLWQVAPDEDVKVLNSSTPMANVEQAARVLLRFMAAGLGVSYSHLARDYSQSNYSSTRQEENVDRRGYGAVQWMLWERHTRPLYTRWVTWQLTNGAPGLKAALRQAIGRSGARATSGAANGVLSVFKANPLMPGFDAIDPVKDATADQMYIDMGVASPQTTAARRGLDWRVEMRKRLEAEKAEREARAEMGLPEAPPSVAGTVNPSTPQEDLDQEQSGRGGGGAGDGRGSEGENGGDDDAA